MCCRYASPEKCYEEGFSAAGVQSCLARCFGAAASAAGGCGDVPLDCIFLGAARYPENVAKFGACEAHYAVSHRATHAPRADPRAVIARCTAQATVLCVRQVSNAEGHVQMCYEWSPEPLTPCTDPSASIGTLRSRGTVCVLY